MARKISTPFGLKWQNDDGTTEPYTGQDQPATRSNEAPQGLDTPTPEVPPSPPARPGGILNMQWASANGGTLPTTQEEWDRVDAQFPGLPWTAPAPATPPPAAPPAAPTAPPPVDPAILEELGIFETPQIGRTVLPANPQLSSTFTPEFNDWWNQFTAAQTTDIGKFYDWGDWPTMEAAQLDTRKIPQPKAQDANAAFLNPNSIAQPDAQRANIATASAAQLDPGALYRPTTQMANAATLDASGLPEMESFDALQFLLSGKGFDDATVAKMDANAIDNISRQARSQRGSARLMAEQMGADSSPAAMAIEAQVNRRQGDATTQALNKLDIENAVRGLENLRLGAGMESNRQQFNVGNEITALLQNLANTQQSNLVNASAGNDMEQFNAQQLLQALLTNTGNQQQTNIANMGATNQGNQFNASAENNMRQFNAANQIGVQQQNTQNQQQTNLTNAQQANLMALQSAANILTAMQQNVQNVQQANQINTENKQEQNMTRAGAQAGLQSGLASNYNTALLNRANNADQGNVANTIAANFKQADLDRDRDTFNAGNQMQRYGWDTSNLINLMNMTGSNNFYNQGTQLTGNQSGNSVWADILRGLPTA